MESSLGEKIKRLLYFEFIKPLHLGFFSHIVSHNLTDKDGKMLNYQMLEPSKTREVL